MFLNFLKRLENYLKKILILEFFFDSIERKSLCIRESDW